MVSGSVIDEKDVERAIKMATKPVRGVIQASMVLKVCHSLQSQLPCGISGYLANLSGLFPGMSQLRLVVYLRLLAYMPCHPANISGGTLITRGIDSGEAIKSSQYLTDLNRIPISFLCRSMTGKQLSHPKFKEPGIYIRFYLRHINLLTSSYC